MKTVSKQLLNKITQRLAAEFEPDQIILFGSHAWGEPDENSDLDLLVIVPQSDEPRPQRATRAYRCLRDIIVPMDILVRTRAEVERHRQVYASLVAEVLERGTILYEKSTDRTRQSMVH